MAEVNMRKIMAMNNARQKQVLAVNPYVPKVSGIYILTRFEGSFKYAYIGQATNLLQRLADHLKGYPQHIDKSIYKHKLWNAQNLTGWKIDFNVVIDKADLDKVEQEYIEKYANAGFQMRNKTVGGQGTGKINIVDVEVKGYHNGLKNGYKNAQKYIAGLFAKNLTVSINGKGEILKDKALKKFMDFITIIGDEEENGET